MLCPTGALQFTRQDGGDEEPTPVKNVVNITENGPLYIRGDIEVNQHDGKTIVEDRRAVLCRCDESRNKPFCDNTHKNSGFRDDGTLDKASSGEDSGTGRLAITATVNGPLFLKGEFEIQDSDGAPSYRPPIGATRPRPAGAAIPAINRFATAATVESDGGTTRRRWYNRI